MKNIQSGEHRIGHSGRRREASERCSGHTSASRSERRGRRFGSGRHAGQDHHR